MELTDKVVRELAAPEKGSKIYPDDHPKAVSNFGVRITAAGALAWVLRYRHNGRSITYTIGDARSMKASVARREAERLYDLVRQGRDPQAEKKAAREAPTMRDLARRAVADHFSKKRPATRVDVYGDKVDEKTRNPLGGQLAKWIIPNLGALKVDDVRPSHIESLHAKVTKAGSPIRANRCVSTISKMMSLAIRWEWRTDGVNPCKGAVERNVEHPRERYLSAVEIARLSEALADHPSQVAADAIRLLLLSGARRMEVLSARGSDFDLKTKIWTKPAQNTKQGRIHHVPLEGAILELVTRLKGEKKGDYLFPGRGIPHLTDIKKSWATICEAAQLGAVRVHDLRHTYASVLASGQGSTLLLIGKLLGHSSAVSTARYSHLFDEPQRAATKTAGDIIAGKPKAEVIDHPMRGRR